jgi:hypothetical protein
LEKPNNINSRSVVLVATLANYLAVAYLVRHSSNLPKAPSNSPDTVLTELAKLSEKVTVLEQQAWSGVVLSNLPTTVLNSDAESANITSLENIK